MTEHGRHIGEIYKGQDGKWRWRVKSWTGEKMYGGQAYYSRSNAKRGFLTAVPSARPCDDQSGGRGVWSYEVD